MLGACRQTCVRMGRSQGKTRALGERRRRERTEDQGRSQVGDNTLAVVVDDVERERQVQSGTGRRQEGSVPVILSHIYNSLLAAVYLRAPPPQQSPISISFEAALQGTAQSWATSGVTTKAKLIPKVHSLFWEGGEMVWLLLRPGLRS